MLCPAGHEAVCSWHLRQLADDSCGTGIGADAMECNHNDIEQGFDTSQRQLTAYVLAYW